jgi:hypothetical protein
MEMEIAATILLIWILLGGIVLLGAIFWIWMLIDVAIKKSLDSSEKIVWVLIILFTHFLGALIYFFVRWIPDRRRLPA